MCMGSGPDCKWGESVVNAKIREFRGVLVKLEMWAEIWWSVKYSMLFEMGSHSVGWAKLDRARAAQTMIVPRLQTGRERRL